MLVVFGIASYELVKSKNSIKIVIPAKPRIQLFQEVLDPDACPGHDQGLAGLTILKAFCETITSERFQK